ncbi:hypothetical protein V6N12_069536 [Hibiscus sabdariffa]|uniref:Uncharacterized protein n=1 Tax=Hibiscus sabdariffa TaxID=183260 RepID=A0ABR2FE50_9ROSI
MEDVGKEENEINKTFVDEDNLEGVMTGSYSRELCENLVPTLGEFPLVIAVPLRQLFIVDYDGVPKKVCEVKDVVLRKVGFEERFALEALWSKKLSGILRKLVQA